MAYTKRLRNLNEKMIATGQQTTRRSRWIFLCVVGAVICAYPTLVQGTGDNDVAQDDPKRLIHQLNDDSAGRRQAAAIKIHALGKRAIPRLIDTVTDSRPAQDLLKNPRSSNLQLANLESSLGLVCAYLIELILGREAVRIDASSGEGFFLGAAQNYPYWDGLIVNAQGRVIKVQDLREVKSIYQKWWDTNKDKPLDELRRDWSAGRGPLAGSEYRWN